MWQSWWRRGYEVVNDCHSKKILIALSDSNIKNQEEMFNFFTNTPTSKVQDALDFTLVPELRRLVVGGNFDEAHSLYEQQHWTAQSLLVEGVGLDSTLKSDLKKWVDARPKSFVAQLFYGAQLTKHAWLSRSAKLAKHVSQSQADLFVGFLENAYDHLDVSIELNGRHAETFARMIRVCMGLGADMTETESYFQQAIAVIPEHLNAHVFLANYLNPKWGGSVTEMLSFARLAYENRPNSILIVLPLFAMVEEELYYNIIEPKNTLFFQSKARAVGLAELFDGYIPASATQLLTPIAYNYFSYLFYNFKDKDRFKKAIAGMDLKLTTYPWSYLGIETVKKLQKL
jgi:tetratricopeptide (TPR) repeat protein